MSSRLIAAAVLLAVGVLQAQNAPVQNAATVEFTTLATNLYVGTYVASVANIVSPGMLATLTYSGQTVAPTSPATVSIRSSGSNMPIRVELTSFGPGSVTFAIPRNMPLGGAEIEYKVEGQPTAWTLVNVVGSSFDFFRIGPSGPPIAQSVAANGSFSPIGLTTPAQPGQTIRLTGTGLGNAPSVSVTVGGVPATIVKTQPHHTQPGIDEILFEMPQAVPDGCYLPLVFAYNQTATVTSTISKTSNGAPCVHPFQLSVADMKTLDNGGSLSTAEIEMVSDLDVATATAASRDESANIELTTMTAAQIAAQFAPNLFGSGPACRVLSPTVVLQEPVFLNGVFPAPAVPTPPDLGAMSLQNAATTLSLTGSSGYYSAAIPQPTQGPLSNPPAPVIAGGNWTWQSAGGTDLAATSFTFTLPAPFQLSGSAPPSVSRNQDQTLTWNGAAYDASAILNVMLSGTPVASGLAAVNCTVPASAGTLSIPSSLLAQLPGGILGSLLISLQEIRPSHAQFKLNNGSTLLMFVNYSSTEQLPVDIQ